MHPEPNKTIEETPPESPPSPSSIGHLPIEGEVYREGGMWKIRLIVPEWIMHDIERDIQGSTLACIIINPLINKPGIFYSGPDRWYMSSMARFEWSVEK